MFYLPDDEMQSDVLIQGVLRIYETKTGISGVVQTCCFAILAFVLLFMEMLLFGWTSFFYNDRQTNKLTEIKQ